MISTKNIDNSESANKDFVKSVLTPGNYLLKINKVFLRPESKPEFGVKLMLFLESKVIGDSFKGLMIDAKNPASGNYLGQVGTVSYSRYGLKDSELYGTSKEEEILKAIKTLCEGLGLMSWWDSTDMRFETVEALVEGFSTEAPFNNVWAYYCLSGKEYMSRDGKHVNYELYLPYLDRVLGKPFSLDENKVQKYFYSTHVVPLTAAGVTTKTAENTNTPAATFTDKTVTTNPNQSAEDFLAEINAPVEQIYHKDPDPTQPVRPAVTSQLEQNFMDAGKKSETPFTNSIMNDIKEESKSDIITASADNPWMPWDPQFEEWEKANKK